MKYSKIIVPTLAVCTLLILPEIAFGSVESTLNAIQNKFINTLMPVLGVIGICWAGFSFLMGNPNARSHLFLAAMGAVVGFGAPSIISFIRSLVH